MEVFISWSGDEARTVAEALRDWLPKVLQSIDPFISSGDIPSGARWQKEIAVRLERINFGLVCVTRENQRSTWLNFEVGALAKSIEEARVVPLAIDLPREDIEQPIAHFHAELLDADGMKKVILSMNEVMGAPVKQQLLESAFAMWWPELEDALAKAAEGRPTEQPEPRNERALLVEVLETVRSLARRGDESVLTEGGHDLALLMRQAVELTQELRLARGEPEPPWSYKELAGPMDGLIRLEQYVRELGSWKHEKEPYEIANELFELRKRLVPHARQKWDHAHRMGQPAPYPESLSEVTGDPPSLPTWMWDGDPPDTTGGEGAR